MTVKIFKLYNGEMGNLRKHTSEQYYRTTHKNVRVANS